MRASLVAPAVPLIGNDRGEERGHDRTRPIALSKLASTPDANDVIERDSPVAI
ncbi:hypothetical protein [Caballeronia mineralivorans]|jgi:hypothetical protein|uniref:hypothetical protein n=1 Tax=Caballeronia mineralivorans TaxID=2010198 RepID=UPI0023F1BFA4|nr:hypothetical protein [Caballeronia mineralivorans]MDB5783886.1 hypothetical protein [Caballeronia mineralivorans]MEA3105268.1 hypothetical protein [Caballeronia mineralivorans]